MNLWMLGTIYGIVAVGILLACLFEGERVWNCILFAILWPFTLAAILFLRNEGPKAQ